MTILRPLLSPIARPLGVPSAGAAPAPLPTYATWNPADKAAAIILSNNNLTAEIAPLSGWVGVRATLGKSAGKWAFEVYFGGGGRGTYMVPGLASASWNVANYYPGGDTNGIGINPAGPYWHIYNNRYVVPNIGSDWTPGDIATLLWDADTGDLTTKRNGVQVSTKSLPQFAGVEMFPAVGLYTASDACLANFGPLQYPEAGYSDGWYAE